AEAEGVRADVRGVVDQRRLPELYASADAFVLASFTEGHPKVLLEAMSSGVACVVSDCAGNRSLVTDGVTGLLFDPRRAGELTAGLHRLVTDQTPAAALVRPARKTVIERYEPAARREREIALLQELGARR